MAYADKTLYITDLDGTLLRSDKTLSEYTAVSYTHLDVYKRQV